MRHHSVDMSPRFCDETEFLTDLVTLADSKKKSNFLCSIICCLGKRGSRRRRKDKDAQGGGTGSGAAGSRGSSSHGSGDAADASGGSAGGPPPKSGMGGGASSSAAAGAKPLLGELRSDDAGKKCIVIDLDETLVHSSFKVGCCYSIDNMFLSTRFRPRTA
jgi:hypothetical protein